MKNIILVFIISFFSINSFAQYREVEEHKEKKEESHGFQKDHLFTGGGIQLSLSSYDFAIGVSPVLGYSINKWLDVGVGLNYTYISQREVDINGYLTGYKIRQNDIGPLAFVKFYPLKFLFIQAQFEENFISQKAYYGGQLYYKDKFNAPSLLTGVGYCGGREDVGDFYYYISISIDVLKDQRSPYVLLEGSNVSYQPVLKAGIQVPLFQGRR